MDTDRDQYFSPQDAEEWAEWSDQLDEDMRDPLNAYLIALAEYYGNREEAA